MGRKFNKKNATTYNVVHRAHDDARFFDDDASLNVLVPTNQGKSTSGNNKRIFTTHDLEESLKDKVRENEGMAAQYGITYDDSKYDYMQHLKPLGNSDGVFIARKQEREEAERKQKMKLEDLLRDQLPSEQKRKVLRDLNQSIPDELKGFQPDMDPRLREVLEALEDEAYIEEVVHKGGENGEDEEDYEDDVFADLLKSGEVEDEDEFYEDYYDGEDGDYDEWDLDNYADQYDAKYDETPEELVGKEEVNTNWQRDFMKFKKEDKHRQHDWDSDDDFDEEDDEEDQESTQAQSQAHLNGEVVDDNDDDDGDQLGDLPDVRSKKSKTKLRKKKGAMTDTSSFSMSSSALFRTEGLSLLDDRYEQLNKKYVGSASEARAPQQVKPFDMKEERTDLEGLLDDFLDNYELESGGRKLAKKDEEKKKLQEAANSVSRGKKAKSLNKAFGRMTLE